ncbi:MAG: DoxX family protein [Burkholderiales bacterium]|nr:DoxX family protein [Burkholderiales bacterium]
MNTHTPPPTRGVAAAEAPPTAGALPLEQAVRRVIRLFERIPHSLIAFVARFSIAAVFWSSGQTKVQGFVVNILTGEVHLGWPRLSDSVIDLFRDEYKLPFIPPEIAAPMAATAEHVFPLLLLIGLGTRFSALALLGMTMVIEIFVYPDAYPTHGTWAAIFLYLMARGPGKLSIDHWLATGRGAAH